MKKIFFLILFLAASSAFAEDKKTTFTNELFINAQKQGKLIVINSWNKTCTTCAKQVQILKKAEEDFNDVIFLSFEQETDKDIAKLLSIDYWTTIVIYKRDKEVYRSIGETDKSKIYSNIKKNI